MASVFEIKGFTQLFTGSTVIGQSDADDLPEWEEQVFERVIHTNESGPEMFAKGISHGRAAIVRVNLIKFDKTQVDILRKAPGATLAGQLGNLGADVPTFALKLESKIVGSDIYTFPTCRMLGGEVIGDRQWGLMENKLFFVFASFPDPALLSTATTPYWIKTVVS